MKYRYTRISVIIAAAAVTLVLAGCGSAEDISSESASASFSEAIRNAFVEDIMKAAETTIMEGSSEKSAEEDTHALREKTAEPDSDDFIGDYSDVNGKKACMKIEKSQKDNEYECTVSEESSYGGHFEWRFILRPEKGFLMYIGGTKKLIYEQNSAYSDEKESAEDHCGGMFRCDKGYIWFDSDGTSFQFAKEDDKKVDFSSESSALHMGQNE